MPELTREHLTVFARDPHAATEDEIREMAAELIMERSQSKVLATMARQHGDLLQRVVALAGADTEDVGVWAAAVDQVVTEHLALRIRVREFQEWQRDALAQFARLGFDRYSRLMEGMGHPTDLSDALDAVLDERDLLRERARPRLIKSADQLTREADGTALRLAGGAFGAINTASGRWPGRVNLLRPHTWLMPDELTDDDFPATVLWEPEAGK